MLPAGTKRKKNIEVLISLLWRYYNLRPGSVHRKLGLTDMFLRIMKVEALWS